VGDFKLFVDYLRVGMVRQARGTSRRRTQSSQKGQRWGYEIYLTDISRNSIKLLLLGQGSCYPNYLTHHKLSI
jgi:hypothetical protein